MTGTSEKELLASVLAQLDGQEPTNKNKWWRLLPSLFLWVGAFVVVMLYMSFGGPPHWSHALIALTALVLGHYWSYHLYRASYRRQWPLLAPHFDRSSVEARLSELGA